MMIIWNNFAKILAFRLNGEPIIAKHSARFSYYWLILLVLGLFFLVVAITTYKPKSKNLGDSAGLMLDDIEIPQIKPAVNKYSNESISRAIIPENFDVKHNKEPANKITNNYENDLMMLNKRLQAPLLVGDEKIEKDKFSVRSSIVSKPNNEIFDSGQNAAVKVQKIPVFSRTVAAGTIINATLETAINSDLPGQVRALTAEPIYAETSDEVLIPRGSRLVGAYKSAETQGLSRIFVIWQRIITPNGLSINVNSPSSSPLGVAGVMADDVNRHFWLRFSEASLLAIIGASTQTIASSEVDDNYIAQLYKYELSRSFQRSVEESLKSSTAISPTLTVNQGQRISILVARDLDFSEV